MQGLMKKMATQLSSLRRNAKLDIKGVKRPTLPTKVVALLCENGLVKTIQVLPHNQKLFLAEFEEDPGLESCGMLYTSKTGQLMAAPCIQLRHF